MMIVDLLPYRQDIVDFINVTPLKNGSCKIKFPAEKVTNIYSFIKKLGFGYIIINGRSMFIRQSQGDINRVGFIDVESAFRDCLAKCDFTLLPDGIVYQEVMNEYFRQSPLKESNLLKYHLKTTLNDENLHLLRIKIDLGYRKGCETNEMLLKLQELNFKTVTDQIGTYHDKGEQLFFKSIGSNKFLIFNYINNPKYGHQIFDSWVSTFPNEKSIGVKPFLKNDPIIVDFKIARDYHLIAHYLS